MIAAASPDDGFVTLTLVICGLMFSYTWPESRP